MELSLPANSISLHDIASRSKIFRDGYECIIAWNLQAWNRRIVATVCRWLVLVDPFGILFGLEAFDSSVLYLDFQVLAVKIYIMDISDIKTNPYLYEM